VLDHAPAPKRHAPAAPAPAGATGLLQLQGTAGNHAVARLVEAQRLVDDTGSGLRSDRFRGEPTLEAVQQGQRLLRAGASGEAVTRIQQALMDLGYAMPRFGADGQFGGETTQAVVAYQRDHDLGPDGIVGPNTLGSLDGRFAGGTEPGPEPGAGTTPGGDLGGLLPGGGPGGGLEPIPVEPGGGTAPVPGGGGPAPGGEGPAGGTDQLSSPALVQVYVQATLSGSGCTEQQFAALKALDIDATGPWAHVDWGAVQVGAARRVFDPSLISQESLNVCGPATLANMQADVNPLGYARFVLDVFQTATIDGTRAVDDLLNNTPVAGMDQADWMLLSAMRDTENWMTDFEGTPSEAFEGITMPAEMAEWMEEVLGASDVEQYTSYLWGEVDNATTVSQLLSAHGKNVVVAMLVDADALQQKQDALKEQDKFSQETGHQSTVESFGEQDWSVNYPDHWVRLLEPIRFEGDHIIVKVFTWGAEYVFTYDEELFEDVLFEFVVGALKPDIELP
jgi:peptidoglycan hydrolase-like protein with peptidoglycan-binding domain